MDTTSAAREYERSDERSTRLRAGLRLIFDDRLPDQLAALADGSGASLRHTARLAVRQYRLLQLRRVVRRDAVCLPLAPRRGLGARAALALALHLGLDLDLVDLADLFQTTPEQLARGLAAARRAVDPSLPRGCAGEDVLARAPLAAGPQARMALAAHLRGCGDCRRALAEGEALDARLREAIACETARLPASMAPPQSWRLRAGWLGALVAGVLILALLLAGAGAALARWLPHGDAPVPLVASADQPPSGWLVRLTQQRQLQAVSTDGRRARLLQDLGATQGFAQPFISPKGDLVALANSNTASLEFARLGGQVISTHIFEANDEIAYYNGAGWLDDDTFLVIAMPLYRQGESQAFYEMRAAGQTHLFAVDAGGGARQLFQGDLCSAYPSPDGTLIAIAVCSTDGTSATLDLRPVTPDGLGPSIARLDRELRSIVVWSPDSRRCYFAGGGPPPQNPLASPAPLAPTPYELNTLDRDGRLSTLTSTTRLALGPLAVTPDGANLIYNTLDGTPQPRDTIPTLHLWRLPLDGGQPVQLAAISGAVMPSNGFWSPDGHTLLLPLSRRYFLSDSDAAPAANTGTQSVTELLAIGPDWTPRPLSSELDGYSGWVVGWLPSDALPPAPAPSFSSHAVAPAQLDALRGYRLDARSSASPDGAHAVVVERDSGLPAIWARDERNFRRLPAGVADLDWLPDGSGVVGVAPAELASDPNAVASRLTLYAPAFSPNGFFPLDFHTFDPARLGDDTRRRYARPLSAPGGNLLSFFVLDPARQRVELWLTGWDLPPRQLAEWPLPSSAEAALPPLAVWADGHTLIVARPGDWQGTLPQAATLLRVTVAQDGIVAITTLVTLTGHGGDHGIALVELALSPDGSRLAYRLRHYLGDNLSGSRDDSLRVAPAGDLRQSIELARGPSGEGLAWAPDSTWLAAPLRGQLLLLAADGSASQTLTAPGQDAADPLWLDDQIWVSLDGDAGPEIWQVPLS